MMSQRWLMGGWQQRMGTSVAGQLRGCHGRREVLTAIIGHRVVQVRFRRCCMTKRTYSWGQRWARSGEREGGGVVGWYVVWVLSDVLHSAGP
jgi:hypothetical protein